MVEKDSPPSSFLSPTPTPTHSAVSPSHHHPGGPASLNLARQKPYGHQTSIESHSTASGARFGQEKSSIPGSKAMYSSHAPSKRPHQETVPPTSGSSHASFAGKSGRDGMKAVNTSVSSVTSLTSLEDNRLEMGLDREIGTVADDVRELVGGDGGGQEGEEKAPYDPNLECPTCGRKFRLGQIQHFRQHAAKCNNKIT